MSKKKTQKVAALAVLFFAWAVGASAQGTTGGVGGTLVDSSGGILPGVMVTLSGPNLQGVRTVTSDSEGFYHFRAVPPGSAYKVTADLSGFRPATRENIQVFLGQEGTVNLTLVPAGVTEGRYGDGRGSARRYRPNLDGTEHHGRPFRDAALGAGIPAAHGDGAERVARDGRSRQPIRE